MFSFSSRRAAGSRSIGLNYPRWLPTRSSSICAKFVTGRGTSRQPTRCLVWIAQALVSSLIRSSQIIVARKAVLLAPPPQLFEQGDFQPPAADGNLPQIFGQFFKCGIHLTKI